MIRRTTFICELTYEIFVRFNSPHSSNCNVRDSAVGKDVSRYSPATLDSKFYLPFALHGCVVVKGPLICWVK